MVHTNGKLRGNDYMFVCIGKIKFTPRIGWMKDINDLSIDSFPYFVKYTKNFRDSVIIDSS